MPDIGEWQRRALTAEARLASIHSLARQVIDDILVGEPRLYNFARAVQAASRPTNRDRAG